jgi:hypothetical protein
MSLSHLPREVPHVFNEKFHDWAQRSTLERGNYHWPWLNGEIDRQDFHAVPPRIQLPHGRHKPASGQQANAQRGVVAP